MSPGSGDRPFRVLKFGGTSVTGLPRVEVLARVVAERARTHRPVVVVSAFSGVTDALGRALEVAALGGDWAPLVEELQGRHERAVDELVARDDALHAVVRERFEEVGRLLQGVALVREWTPRLRDAVLSTGETLSARILAAALEGRGVPAQPVPPGAWLPTDGAFGSAEPDLAATAETLSAALPTFDGVAVVPGFIGASREGETTTLGRGGSDLSAAVLGVCLPADRVEIWTDVDGVLTADPRIVGGAETLARMSFDELLELAHWGAKVVQPAAARLLRARGVPLEIRNTADPDALGTGVDAQSGTGEEHPVRALASRSHATLLHLDAPGVEDPAALTARALEALRQHRIEVIMMTQGSSEAAVCVLVPDSARDAARRALDEAFHLERLTGRVDAVRAEEGCTVVTVVGDGMRRRVGISGRVFGVLGHHGVNVRAIAQGASERNISVVVTGEQGPLAVRAIHQAFFAPRPRAAEVWVAGVGRVGETLLDQLAERAEHQRLRVVGIGRSRVALLAPDGVDLTAWRDAVEAADDPPELLVEAAVSSAHHPRIFVDCTASSEVPRHYRRLLESGVSVVAANKVGFAGPVEDWRGLRESARVGASAYYETTVGAGLPVLRTVADLVDTGDRVLRLQGVLSGTLGYLCDQVMQGAVFSEAVREAHGLGYTEPHPADDLSGMDVARKLVILARSAGLELELGDIEVASLLPGEADVPLEEFWSTLPRLDDGMERRRAEAAAEGRRLVYMGTVDEDGARVGLEAVGPQHPCASLRGSENLVLVVSERYRETPLVVRGPGAGPQVTAAGVFADILRARAEAQEVPVPLPDA